MITVGVVDDSPTIRRLMRAALERDGDISVVGEAQDTTFARAMLIARKPSVLTLDVELPGENGIDFLKTIMEQNPIATIMVSTLTAQGAQVSIDALGYGAVNCLQKPTCKADVPAFEHTLRQMVRNAANYKVQSNRRFTRRTMVRRAGADVKPELIAIAASTGGIKSTSYFLTSLPHDCPPIVITQHMQPAFLAQLAKRMNDDHPFDIALAREGEVLGKGMVRLAPPGHHLIIERSGHGLITTLEIAASDTRIVPAADPMLLSIARNVGGNVIAAVLSGMGKDGMIGMVALRKAGAKCIGESKETCVVYGMSKSAMAAGGVEKELPIQELGNYASGLMGFYRDRNT